jgi:hypothetical protein
MSEIRACASSRVKIAFARNEASLSMFFGRMPFARTHGVNGISSSATAVRNMHAATA